MATALTTANLPITYNPPPHPSIQFVTPDLGADASVPEYVNDKAVDPSNPKVHNYPKMLGSIYMGEAGFTYALKEAGTKYGFRFLYNPTTISGGQNVGSAFIPDPSDTVTAVLQEGLEQISFQVLLNRTPEVIGGAKGSDYAKPVSDKDMDELRYRGTHYDLEFLYRCANGLHNTTGRTGTGDIGILLPNPCYLDIGPFHTRGALMSINVNDIMFNDHMIPVLTYVDIRFIRYITMKKSPDSERFRAQPGSTYESVNPPDLKFNWVSLITGSFTRSQEEDSGGGGGGGDEEPEEPSDGGGGGGGGGGGSGNKLSGAAVQKLAKDAGFNEAQSVIMTKIAFAESGWNPKAYNGKGCDMSYGLWQINMVEGRPHCGNLGPGRRRENNLSKNSDLYNPATNAKVARKVYQGQGYGAWSGYKSPQYYRTPAW